MSPIRRSATAAAVRQEQMMEEGQAPTKPRFNINIPLGSGKRAEQEDGLQTDSFFNAKRKKRSWSVLRQAQEDTEKGRAAMREKAGVGTRRTKAAGTAARRADCCRATGAGAVGGKRQLLESAGRTGGRAGITAFLSVFGTTLINRVAPAAGSGYAREDQAVLHTLKSNMPNAGVRPVVDSADWDHPSHLHEERMGDPLSERIFLGSRQSNSRFLEEEDIADGFISMQKLPLWTACAGRTDGIGDG